MATKKVKGIDKTWGGGVKIGFFFSMDFLVAGFLAED
jgi:hypothetical protein